MPRCYHLSVCAGSSLDQHSNNITLFNLVEQINIPPGAPPPPAGLVPLEIHAYFVLASIEIGQPFEVRFAIIARSGLETLSEVFSHRAVTPRFRTRTLGLPLPPVVGEYELRIDWRHAHTASWTREQVFWPLVLVEASAQPQIKH
jgi:hypothetical protein